MGKMSTFENSSFMRRDFLTKSVGSVATIAAATAGLPRASLAEIEVPPQSKTYDFPNDWGLGYSYDQDAEKVRNHMVIATGLAKGSDRMEEFGKNMKKEMIEFVSYYKRIVSFHKLLILY